MATKNGIGTAVPCNWKPVCYQWATLTPIVVTFLYRSTSVACRLHFLAKDTCYPCLLSQPKSPPSNDVTIYFDQGQSSFVVDRQTLTFISPFLGRVLEFTNEIQLRFVNQSMVNCMYDYVKNNTTTSVPVEIRKQFNRLFNIFQNDIYVQGSDMETLEPMVRDCSLITLHNIWPPSCVMPQFRYAPPSPLCFTCKVFLFHFKWCLH